MAQPSEARLGAQLEHPSQVEGNVGHGGETVGPGNDPHFQDHADDHTHHVPMSAYYTVFAFLMVMLLLTVGAWYVDQHVFSLGHWSVPIAMGIAIAKALSIVLIFMHVKFSSRLVQIFACTGIAFAFIMFVLTFNDYGTRSWVPMSGITVMSDGQTAP